MDYRVHQKHPTASDKIGWEVGELSQKVLWCVLQNIKPYSTQLPELLVTKSKTVFSIFMKWQILYIQHISMKMSTYFGIFGLHMKDISPVEVPKYLRLKTFLFGADLIWTLIVWLLRRSSLWIKQFDAPILCITTAVGRWISKRYYYVLWLGLFKTVV